VVDSVFTTPLPQRERSLLATNAFSDFLHERFWQYPVRKDDLQQSNPRTGSLGKRCIHILPGVHHRRWRFGSSDGLSLEEEAKV
jgi:hypothetical protein